MDSKVDGATWVRVTIIVAIIGCIGALGAAFIGILPDILKSATSVSSAVPAPSTTAVSSQNTQNPIATPLPNNILFFDNFDNGLTAKWVNYSSSSFKDGQIYISSGYLISGSNDLQNYSISAEVKLVSGNIDFSLVARFKDQDHFYSCQLWHDQMWIVITGDNLPQGTFDWLSKNSYNFNLGESYKTRMDVQGKSISCYLNDKLVASASDDTYSTGKFGIRVYDTEAAVDNVEVIKLP